MSYMHTERLSFMGKVTIGAICTLLFLIIIGLVMWVLPQYNVWSQNLSGQAALKKAQHTKQIMIETAKAEVESATLRAQAIAIVGEAAKTYPEYRHQEFIGAFGEALKDGSIHQIVYVPTEAMIPITEAGKRPAN